MTEERGFGAIVKGYGGVDSCITECMVINEWIKFSLFLCV